MTPTRFQARTCTDCPAAIYVTPSWAGDALCLACARTRVGIDWPSGQPIGEVLPTRPSATKDAP